ncbi:MAG: GNAT family N-acetyltransferase [Bacteroidales bacterium]|nr:GNAT family N-acetyltransferase [Bacteroidales bacterium]
MLYEFAHFLQNRVRPVWNLIEDTNAALFRLRYGSKLKHLPQVTAGYPGVERVVKGDAEALAAFFAGQPDWVFRHFNPHGFDSKTIARLSKNPSMLMYVMREEGQIVGYFFLRCFFIGKNYLGKMVDAGRQGKGIGQRMCCCAMDITTALGMRMFESISKNNLSSLGATQKVLETRIVKELENDVLYIEDVRKKPVCG